ETLLVGWLPSADLDVCRALLAGSADHERFFQFEFHNKGTLSVEPRRDEPSPYVAYLSARTTVRYPAWVPRQLPAPPPPKDAASEGLAGGDWKRGEAVFVSEEAK